MANLHLVDATYELFRMYTVLPSRRSPDGRECGAVYGLLETLLKLDPRLRILGVGSRLERSIRLI